MYSKNDVKEFIEMLEGSSLSVLEIKNGDGSAIRLEKAISAAPAVVMQANAPASVNESAPVAAPAAPACRSVGSCCRGQNNQFSYCRRILCRSVT